MFLFFLFCKKTNQTFEWNVLCKEKIKRKINVEKINETVDKIVHLVINQASKRQAVKEDVSLSIQHAIKDVISQELQPDEESGFSFTEYDHLEIYQGPTKLLNFIDEEAATNGSANASATDGSIRHGEIIIKVRQGEKVLIKADENNDTVISNIVSGEIIIRNVDTNLVLNVARNGAHINDSVELSIVGQAYIKDLTGTMKAEQFKGIVVVKNDL